MHNDYPLSLDKIEIKRQMLSDCQLRIVDFYNIPIGNVKKLMPNIFDKRKISWKHTTLLKITMKAKKHIVY